MSSTAATSSLVGGGGGGARVSEKRFSDAESLSNALEVVVARNRHLELLL